MRHYQGAYKTNPEPSLTRQTVGRGLIRKRCEEGIERAKAKGVTFGRKRKLDKEMVRVAAERYAKAETMEQLAEVYGVNPAKIWRATRNPGGGLNGSEGIGSLTSASATSGGNDETLCYSRE